MYPLTIDSTTREMGSGIVTMLARFDEFEVAQKYRPGVIVGIDPGQVNMGIALLEGDHATLYQIKLPSTTNPVERIMKTAIVMQLVGLSQYKLLAAGIENAAHSAAWGQTALAENRTTAIIELLRLGLDHNRLYVGVPTAIRAVVFKNGRQRAEFVWPELTVKMDDTQEAHVDTASALSVALYAYQCLRGEVD